MTAGSAARARLGWSLLLACGVSGACAVFVHRPPPKFAVTSAQRLDMIRRAQVWQPTDIAAMDVLNGPMGAGSFARGETITCDYVERKSNGLSPKFYCVIPGETGKKPDEIKVKYGVNNPEVYGEVIGTRLLWALGFGADRMYSVRVICRGCPPSIHGGSALPSGDRVFDPAAVERKAEGWEADSKPDQGWAWWEIDLVDPAAGGAPLAQRDALKLLAIMIQHADNKAAQQRLVCLDASAPPKDLANPPCARPFMLINDLGLTFGRADFLYLASTFVDSERWAHHTVFTGRKGCVGNLLAPLHGTLELPVISEEGRAFLANLLRQLSDQQIHDLFAGARVEFRFQGIRAEPTPIDNWVAVFKQKRQEIEDRRCPPIKTP